MTGTRKGTTRTTLSIKDSFALMKLIETEYASSGKTDLEFTEYAQTYLALESKLTKDHIRLRRDELGIPQNYGAKSPASKPRVADLEKRVKALEILARRFETYMGDSPLKAVR